MPILLVDADVLMAIPELYRFGREGTWYGLRLFSIYMLDAIYQVRLFIHQIDARLMFLSFHQSAVIYFFITYAYRVTSARGDGFGGYIYEFSSVSSTVSLWDKP